ncbi:MAG: alpha/beta hydrolase [Xanthobacteraceae bacterium]
MGRACEYRAGTGSSAKRCGGRHGSPWAAGVLASLLLAGCSPASVLNFFVSTSGVEITRSVAYGDGPRRTLDLYRPAGATDAPVVVFFYGGSWQTGDKALYTFLGAALAQRGYLTVVPDYRLYPEVRYPAFLDDGAHAVRWTRDNAARYGGNPAELFVMGHSAGAYIAAMLALDPRWLKEVGLVPDRDLAGLIGVSGPYDFLPLRDPMLQAIFGGANRPTTQPISYVSPGAPPALLMTGTNDNVVGSGNTMRLAARLRASGDEADVATYPRVGHLTIIGSFAGPLRFLAPALRDTDRFMAGTLRGRAQPAAVTP